MKTKLLSSISSIHRYSSVRCPARLHTKNELIIGATKQKHSHAPEVTDIERKKVMQDFKTNVLHSTVPRRLLVQRFCANVDKKLTSVLPSISSMMSTVNRLRKQNNIEEIDHNPKTLAELILSEDEIKTADGNESFLLVDHHSIISQERTVIFASRALLEFLAHCNVWHMDGTFGVAPQLFKQFYTIHGESIKYRQSILKSMNYT